MPVITKEYLDSLPDEDIIFIRDYIWQRFGKGPERKEQIDSEPDEQAEEPLRNTRLSNDSSCCPHCGVTHFIKYHFYLRESFEPDPSKPISERFFLVK